MEYRIKLVSSLERISQRTQHAASPQLRMPKFKTRSLCCAHTPGALLRQKWVSPEGHVPAPRARYQRGVVDMAAVTAMETGSRFMAAEMNGRVDRTDPAGEELGARWRTLGDQRLQGLAQSKRGWTTGGKYHPMLRVADTELRCDGPPRESNVPLGD